MSSTITPTTASTTTDVLATLVAAQAAADDTAALAAALAGLHAALGASGATLWQPTADGLALTPSQWSDGTPPAAADTTVPPGHGAIGRAWDTGEVVLHDEADDGGGPVRGGVAIPIVGPAGVTGVLEVVTAEELAVDATTRLALVALGTGLGARLEAAAARRQAVRADAMLENATTNMMFADTHGRVTYVNPAMSMTQMMMDDHTPVSFLELVGARLGDFHGSNEAYRAALADPATHLPMHQRSTFGPETVDVMVSAIHDEHGVFLGLLETWDVVTFRLQAEEAEREAAQLLRDRVDGLLDAVRAAAGGDLTREVAVEGDDAVAQVAGALAQLLSDLRVSIGGIASHAATLGDASDELQRVSTDLGHSAADTSTRVESVREGTGVVSSSIEEVAAAAGQMNASIREISQNTSHAAQVASQAVGAAADTTATISKLGDSSTEIGKIIKVITGIAQQTNLLALNATIEAARAGEAGKGFAVVANEVKELAKETARATEDISAKIETIQTDTGSAVAAIDQIGEVIREISEIQSTIAAAVEEQAATTAEIARSVESANGTSSEIEQTVAQVAETAATTSTNAAHVQSSASGLRTMSGELRALVARFTV